MKNLFLILLLIVSYTAPCQVVAGLYTGSLVNDSTRKEQRYELALSEYRGKITGYSYTTFVANDTFYYSIKRVKGVRTETEIRIEDDKMVANNFPESAAKGVRQINHIALTTEDTLRTVVSTWETTRTKIYYALSGKGSMQWRKDSSESALIPHLKELGIISQPRYAEEVVVYNNAGVRKNNSAMKPAAITAANSSTGAKEKEATLPRKNVVAPAPANETTAAPQSATVNTATTTPASASPSPQTTMAKPAVLEVTARKKNILPVYETVSDSLELSFYDNGVIDGDSISVYINGEVVFSGAKLTATATKKKVALPNAETIELLLVAENLGSLPPNTGLVVIKDGATTYQLHFSADLQTNAAITIKRKRK